MLGYLQVPGLLCLLAVVFSNPKDCFAQGSTKRLLVVWTFSKRHDSKSLSRLQSILKTNQQRFRRCYLRATKQRPIPPSRMTFDWMFSTQGKKVRCQALGSSKRAKKLASCVCKVVETFRLPLPRAQKSFTTKAKLRFRKLPSHRGSPTKKWGTLSKKEVVSVLRKHLRELRLCYHRSVFPSTPLVWKVSLRWVVNRNGSVSQVKVHHSNVHFPQFHQCLMRSVSGWTFPRPRGGKKAKVQFPFVFTR